MKITYTMVLASLVGVAAASPVSGVPASVVNQAISESEVVKAQDGWCEALVNISRTYAEKDHAAAKALAEEVIDAAYGYQMGAVLFKPTLTTAPQTFRTTRDGALSYFVGRNPVYPDDSGFALNSWTKCEVGNEAIFIGGRVASTMGKVHFTDEGGTVTTVDKTWTFVKDDEGQLRIVGHHSSLEHSAQ